MSTIGSSTTLIDARTLRQGNISYQERIYGKSGKPVTAAQFRQQQRQVRVPKEMNSSVTVTLNTKGIVKY
jgi:hypothetical protein